MGVLVGVILIVGVTVGVGIRLRIAEILLSFNIGTIVPLAG